MEIQIRQITETDIIGFHKCLDSVAREGKFIAKEKAPDIERLKAFINSNISNNFPSQMFAGFSCKVGSIHRKDN